MSELKAFEDPMLESGATWETDGNGITHIRGSRFHAGVPLEEKIKHGYALAKAGDSAGIQNLHTAGGLGEGEGGFARMFLLRAKAIRARFPLTPELEQLANRLEQAGNHFSQQPRSHRFLDRFKRG